MITMWIDRSKAREERRGAWAQLPMYTPLTDKAITTCSPLSCTESREASQPSTSASYLHSLRVATRLEPSLPSSIQSPRSRNLPGSENPGKKAISPVCMEKEQSRAIMHGTVERGWWVGGGWDLGGQEGHLTGIQPWEPVVWVDRWNTQHRGDVPPQWGAGLMRWPRRWPFV